MYILHQRHKRARTISALIVLAMLIGAGSVFGSQYLNTDTTISPTPAAIISTVQSPRASVKHINDPIFAFDVPMDWESFQPTDLTAGARSWRNTKDNKGVRAITLYLDAGIPATYAVNRVVALDPTGDRVTIDGNASDNCTSFTGNTSGSGAQQSPTGTAPSKWQGVTFICDVGNYLRNVVGTGSKGSTNATKLVGSSTGAHTVFITYTDSSASPDFGIFTDMLQSFRIK